MRELFTVNALRRIRTILLPEVNSMPLQNSLLAIASQHLLGTDFSNQYRPDINKIMIAKNIQTNLQEDLTLKASNSKFLAARKQEQKNNVHVPRLTLELEGGMFQEMDKFEHLQRLRVNHATMLRQTLETAYAVLGYSRQNLHPNILGLSPAYYVLTHQVITRLEKNAETLKNNYDTIKSTRRTDKPLESKEFSLLYRSVSLINCDLQQMPWMYRVLFNDNSPEIYFNTLLRVENLNYWNEDAIPMGTGDERDPPPNGSKPKLKF